MIYQKLLTGQKPYYLSGVRRSKSFHLHRHPEIEFFCCLEGRCTLLVNKVRHELTAGDSMATGHGHGHSVESIGEEPLVLLACIVLH